MPAIPTGTNLGRRNMDEKKFVTEGIPRENIVDPRNTNEKIFQAHEGTMARFHANCKTHGI